ncbi:hypothetical protein H0H93_016564 [Arthromyces matolae]|nr:hypothetical protein H0H93_016564 [Arthromyces matolae]
MSDLKRKPPPEIEEPNKRSRYQTARDVFYSDEELLGMIVALLNSQDNRDDDDKNDDPPELKESIAQLFKAVAQASVARDDLPVWSKELKGYLNIASNTESPEKLREIAFKPLVDYILEADEKHPKPKKNTAPAPEPFTHATKAAWQIPYIGSTPQLLKRTIEDICKKQEEFKEFKPYANFLAIIQGSGTGKSRAVDELAQTVFTIPVCIRPLNDNSGYPPGDVGENPVHDFFSVKQLERTAFLYHRRYIMFLLKAIQFADKWIDEEKKKNQPLHMLARRWREYLGAPQTQNRMALFTSACDETALEGFDGIFKVANIQDFSNKGKIDGFKTNVGKYIKTVTDKLYDGDDFRNCTHSERIPVSLQGIDFHFQSNIDLHAISAYSRLSESTPIARNFWSSRPLDRETDEYMHPPFVELPFDTWRPSEGRYMMKEGTHSAEEICSLQFMARFGRPLFGALLQNYAEMDSVMWTAITRLQLPQEIAPIPGMRFVPELLPPVAVRVDLTFETNRNEAVYLEGLLVASSMRTVYSVPQHCQYLRGGYPSEPFVAEAAAQLLYRKLFTAFDQYGFLSESQKKDVEETYKRDIPRHLALWVGLGLISRGIHGELVARLLLTTAHDIAILKKVKLGKPHIDRPSFSQMVPVEDFLAALVGEDYHQAIFSMGPTNTNGQMLKEAFEHGYVHFTQFVKAGDAMLVTDEGAYLMFCRGAAIQYHDNLSGRVDVIIPVWIKSPNHDCPGRWSMTFIRVLVKNRGQKQIISDDEDFKFFTPFPDDKRPSIIITMELGVANTKKPRKVVTKKSKQANTRAGAPVPAPSTPPGNDTSFPMDSSPAELRVKSYDHDRPTPGAPEDRPRYDITIRGCSQKVYSVIPQDNYSYERLLASKDILSEHPRLEPRFSKEYRKAIIQMKPFWVKDESYDWLTMKNTSRVGAATFSDPNEPEVVEIQDQHEDDSEEEEAVICHGQDDEEGEEDMNEEDEE